MNKLLALISQLNRQSDVLLIMMVVAIIGLMVVPLPPQAIDLLIAINLSISVLMLMISLYISSPLQFSVFPSLLLFTTLFRLALAIATTRMILLKAYAGEIILTFGNFVVAGNFVVGAVVFLIITIVQFLVIAKGAERVAEVAARFTLDAMPGKQMSIDADMRAGVIDMDTARERREMVTKESQLYGAMDGAMKFVKGDAIAGLIVTAVNLVGGLAIGIMQKGMPLEAAVKKYSILTIGDGLVSQIPALLICITAGVVVTRVASGENVHLGGDIGKQFLARPKPLIIGGIILLLFMMVPGFPKPQFFLLACIALAIGYGVRKMGEAEGKPDAEAKLAAALAPAGEKDKAQKKRPAGVEEFSITVPLLIDLSESIRQNIRGDELNEEVIRVRRALYYDLGVPFPGINLRFRDDLETDSYVILLQEVPASKGWLPAGKVLVRETAEHLKVMGFEFETGKQFLPGMETVWMPAEAAPRLKQAGLAFMAPTQILVHHLSFLLKKHAGEFIGIQETRFLLVQMEARYGELVKEVQRIMPLQKIAEIFQRLVQEQVSIRNQRSVLEALVEWGQKEKDPILLAEYVRTALKRQISYQHTGGQNVLPVYMLHPSLEEKIRGSIRQTSSGSYLALDPATTAKLVEKIKGEVGNVGELPTKPVLITSMDIRRYVRKLIEADLYDIPVLSYQELTPEITVHPLGKVAL